MKAEVVVVALFRVPNHSSHDGIRGPGKCGMASHVLAFTSWQRSFVILRFEAAYSQNVYLNVMDGLTC